MKQTITRKLLALVAAALVGSALESGVLAQNDQALTITRTVDPSQLISINLNGFSGEALSTLKFDLEVLGFTVKSASEAQYQVNGSNNGQVEGRLLATASKAQIFGKAYSGGTARSQAHALANDIIAALRQVKGIAQTRIAFKGVTGDTSEAYVADYDGFNPVMVTSDRSIVAAPTWVPGKRVLYYTSYRLGNPDIYSQSLQTGERKVIARYTGLNTSAAISPDGTRIAMILSKAGSPDLYVANADGTGLKQLTQTKEDESCPCWSPDGTTICFTSRVNHRAELFTIPSGGGTMKKLRTMGVINVTEPDWSPDGSMIAFTANMGSFQICVLELKTGNTKVLTGGEDPSWAPNSRTLAFTRRTRAKNVVSLLDVPTKQVKDIAQISASCSQVGWAR